MKQETLEDVVVKRINNNPLLELHRSTCYQFAFLGAKWQSERSYSEEEVIDLLKAQLIEHKIYGGRVEVEEWFEQFKK